MGHLMSDIGKLLEAVGCDCEHDCEELEDHTCPAGLAEIEWKALLELKALANMCAYFGAKSEELEEALEECSIVKERDDLLTQNERLTTTNKNLDAELRKCNTYLDKFEVEVVDERKKNANFEYELMLVKGNEKWWQERCEDEWVEKI